ncbi:MAG: Hsp33 family molecular chaperone HslO [Oscillospiraceae bacterium]|nr:Hsp33 family molecular chaperone HslO [Oscillospiraceae bacterium]
MDYLVRATAADAQVRAFEVTAREMVETARKAHDTSPVMTAALGRLTMAASLMGFGLKGEKDTVTVRMNGQGPCGSLIAVSDSFGNVKSYVQNPVVEIPLNKYGKLDVRGAVGADGILSVVKDLGLKEPYVGQVPIVSGEIAEDITNYLATSEQVPSVCALGVLVNPDLTVKQAGGYLIELLPFAKDEVIDTIEKNINSMQSVTTLMEQGMTCEEIALKALEGLEPNVLDDFQVNYKCDCSKERVEKALVSIGENDLREMAEDEITEVNCHFCGKNYKFTSEEILGLIKK